MRLLKKAMSITLALALVFSSMYLSKNVYADIEEDKDLTLSWSDTGEDTLEVSQQDSVNTKVRLAYEQKENVEAGGIEITLPKNLFKDVENSVSTSLSSEVDQESSSTGFKYSITKDMISIVNFKEIKAGYKLDIEIEYFASNVASGKYSLKATSGDKESNELFVNVVGQEVNNIEPQSLDTSDTDSASARTSCPLTPNMRSEPGNVGSTNPAKVAGGDDINYIGEIENWSGSTASNVVATAVIPSDCTPDMSGIKYFVGYNQADAKLISTTTDYTATKSGNNVVITSKSLPTGTMVTFVIPTTAGLVDKTVQGRFQINSIDGTNYSGVYSNYVYHKIFIDVANLQFRTDIHSEYYADLDKEFTYDINVTLNGVGLNQSLDVTRIVGATTTDGTISLTNGSGTFKLKPRVVLSIPRMPQGAVYSITQRDEEGYTPDRKSFSGTMGSSTLVLSNTNTFDYKPLMRYTPHVSFRTDITGRNYNADDSFTYSVTPVGSAPAFVGYNLDSYPAKLDETPTFEVNPTAGSTSGVLSLGTGMRTVNCTIVAGCPLAYFPASDEYGAHLDNVGATVCAGSTSQMTRNMCTDPHIQITYPGTYRYIINQNNPNGDKLGYMSYDTSQYRMTITAELGEDKAISAKVSKVEKRANASANWEDVPDKETLLFTNKYEGQDECVIHAKVGFTNGTLAGNDFSFVVEPAGYKEQDSTDKAVTTNQPMPASTTEKNTATGDIYFDNITFPKSLFPEANKVMTFSYKLYQKQPTTTGKISSDQEELQDSLLPGASIKNGKLWYKGVSYDNKVYTINIASYLEESDGVSAVKVVLPESTPTFTNRYLPSGTLSASNITLSKTLVGRNWLTSDSFDYKIVGVDTKTRNAITNGTIVLGSSSLTLSSSKKTGNFGNITFNAADTYTFQITEQKGDINGLSYDTSPRTVTVRATDTNKDGVLEFDVEGNSATNLTFTSTYNATGTLANSIAVSLTSTGRNLISSDSFVFTVAGNNAATRSAITNGDIVLTNPSITITSSDKSGSVYKKFLNNITVKATGSYSFAVTQRQKTVAGMTLDSNTRTFNLTVTDPGTGTLKITPSVTNLTFTNVYKAQGSLSRSSYLPKVVIRGRDWTEADAFAIQLSGNNAVTKNAIANGDIDFDSSAITITKDGTSGFGNITFNASGTYQFALKQSHSVATDLSLDNTTKVFSVTVTDPSYNGTLTTTPAGNTGNALTFTNIFKSGTVEDGSCFLVGSQNLQIRLNGESGSKVALETAENYGSSVKLPAITELSIADNNLVSFEDIEFTRVGTYNFVIFQKEGVSPLVNYDATRYEFTVTVSKNADNSLTAASDFNEIFTFNNTMKRSNVILSLIAKDEDNNAVDDSFTVNVTLTDIDGNGVEGNFPVFSGDDEVGFASNGGTLVLNSGDTVSINNLPVGTRYSFSPVVKEGYEFTHSAIDGVVSVTGNNAEITAVKKVNDPIVNYGSLTITSSVVGDSALSLEFMLTLDSEETFNYTGSKEGTIANGGTFSLNNGESITINNIPEGTYYKVSTRKGDQDTSSVNSEGTIKAFTSTFVEFTSESGEEPPATTGSLQINGTTTGYKESYGTVCKLKVELLAEDGSPLGGSYSYTGEGNGTISNSRVFDISGDSFNLTVTNLPANAMYKLSWESQKFEGGYVSHRTAYNHEGTITAGKVSSATFNLELTEDTSQGEDPETFTSLGISATVENYTENVVATLYLKDSEGNPLTGNYTCTGYTEGTLSSGAKINVENGLNILIKDLPVGSQWEIQVPAGSYSYNVTGQHGTLGTNGASANITIIGRDVSSASDLIVKASNYNEDSKGYEFEAYLVLRDADNNPLTLPCEGLEGKDSLTDGEKFTIKEGLNLTVKDVPNASNVTLVTVYPDKEHTCTIIKSVDSVTGASIFDLTNVRKKEVTPEPPIKDTKDIIIKAEFPEDLKDLTDIQYEAYLSLKNAEGTPLTLDCEGLDGKSTISDMEHFKVTDGMYMVVKGYPIYDNSTLSLGASVVSSKVSATVNASKGDNGESVFTLSLKLKEVKPENPGTEEPENPDVPPVDPTPGGDTPETPEIPDTPPVDPTPDENEPGGKPGNETPGNPVQPAPSVPDDVTPPSADDIIVIPEAPEGEQPESVIAENKGSTPVVRPGNSSTTITKNPSNGVHTGSSNSGGKISKLVQTGEGFVLVSVAVLLLILALSFGIIRKRRNRTR